MAEKPKVLIVDDDNDFREILSAKLLASGFEVNQAINGEAGIEAAKAWKPHIMLLDIRMPGMNGIETLRKIKTEPELADLPVIFLTSLGAIEEDSSWVDDKFAKEAGAIAHIKKSDDLDKIVKKIMDTIYQKQ
jgi:CheY-like chemotaxis protein